MSEPPDLQRFLDDSLIEEVTDVEQQLRRTSSAARISAGNLGRRPFGELLAELYRWRSEGALLLHRGEVKKVVYFREGRPVSVKSNLVAECLGRVLIREKFISETDCEESLRRLQDSRRPQGALLIEMGSISPHNLVYALQLQLQTKLLDIFRWPEGNYRFDSRAVLPRDPIELDLTTAAVIYEGVKRAYGDERVAKDLGDVNKSYPVPSPDPLYRFQEIGLDQEEAALLASLDGSQTVAEIAIAGRLSASGTLRFLLAMRVAQVLEFHDEPTHEPLPREVREQLAPPVDSPAAAKFSPPALAAPRPPKIQPRLQAEQLRAKVSELRPKSHFEVLGVSEDADAELLRPAYLALAREYHPDKHFSSASAEVRELAAEIYTRATAAYEVLSDPEERGRYVAALRAPKNNHEGPDAISNILAAEGRFERGKALLDDRKLGEAIEHFREAVRLYPSEGEFHAWLGWALFSERPADPIQVTAALEAIEEAIQQSPGLERAHLFLGRIYKSQGRPDLAEREFDRALKCNPDSAESLKELRLLSHR